RGDDRIVGSHQRWSGAVNWLELRRDAFRTGGPHCCGELRSGFIGTLVGHKACADFGHRASRDHGLSPLAGEASANTVHLEGWARPETLEQRDVWLADEFACTHLLGGIVGFVERQTGPSLALLR